MNPSNTFANRTIDSEFSKELFKSEILRATLLAGIFGFFTLIFFISYLVAPESVQMILNYTIPIHLPLLILFGVTVYEFSLQWMIRKVLSKRFQRVPLVPRYLNALIEVNIPSLALLIYGSYTFYDLTLNHPAMFVYFLFIILAILRLDFYLCAFTGFIAGLSFLITMGYVYILHHPETNFSVLSITPIISKAVILFLGGLIAGLVSLQIKRQIQKSFEHAEERNQIMRIFGQHVSPEVVDKLLQQSTELPSEVHHVCVMFLDIRNFTAFSEKRKPQEVIEYLNSLFSFMIDCINRNQGIINKFLGDGFMAVFGAPLSDGKDSEHAIQASLEILHEIEDKIRRQEIPPTAIGIGLHCGEAVTGNVGSVHRKEYTIIGDVVNLASRIETLNKSYETHLLVSKDVKEAIRNPAFTFQMVGSTKVKGREDLVDVFTVI